jgi:hypothetical protein
MENVRPRIDPEVEDEYARHKEYLQSSIQVPTICTVRTAYCIAYYTAYCTIYTTLTLLHYYTYYYTYSYTC